MGLVDRSDAGVLEVTGRDRASFLHAMLSNDIKALKPGEGCAAGFLDAHGKVQVLVVVLALDDRLLVVTPPGMGPATLDGLDRYLFSEKASLHDATGERTLLLLAGPQAPALAERLTGVAVPDTAWSSVAAVLDGVEVRLVRGAGETGEAEAWVICSANAGGRIGEALAGAGARRVGHEALEALRIEAGTPHYGRDVDQGVLLPEIPLEPLVSYTKGCYVGQEVVVRIRDRGHVNRLLRGLVLEGAEIPAPGAPVVVGDAQVGSVTSAAWSFGRGCPVALAFVRRQHADPGTTIGVQTSHGIIPGTVTALPFPR